MARLAIIVVGAALTAMRLRRNLAPRWSGALGALADVVGSIAVVVVVSEVLGTVGLFDRTALVLVLAAMGAASVLLRRAPGGDDQGRDTERSSTGVVERIDAIDVVTMAAATGLVVAEWTSWIAQRVSTGVGTGGPADGDTVWYHLPFAAGFVRSGFTSAVKFVNGDALVAYYPANGSLLHAVGMLAMGRDSLSPFLTLALLPVALLAGWCIGEGTGFAPGGLAAVAVAMSIPVVAVTAPGTAKDDVLGFVGLLAALAFVVHPATRTGRDTERAAALFGGAAAGLALGSKLSFVAPVLALAVGVAAVAPRGRRGRTLALWSGAAVLTGGYWYLRNLLVAGNPVPELDLGVGPLRLPNAATPNWDAYFNFDLGHVLTNAHVWRVALIPGLEIALGRAWPLIVAAMIGTIVVGLVKLRGPELVLPFAGLIALLAFVVTPGTVWVPQLIRGGYVPVLTKTLFGYNLRYLLPVIAIGFASLTVVAARWRRGRVVVMGVLGMMLLTTQLAFGGARAWAGHGGWAAGVGIGAAGAVMVLFGRSRFGSPRSWLVVALVVVTVGFPVVRATSTHRFEHLPLATWAASVAPAKIGYAGFMYSYPLVGPTLANRVEMIGVHGPDGSWHPVRSCRAWRRAVHDGGFRYVVVPVGPTSDVLGIDLARWKAGLPGGEPPNESPESRWTRNDPGARLVFQGQGAGVYRVIGPATTC